MYERHRLSSALPVIDADDGSPIQEQHNILTSQGKQAANILTLLSSLYNLQIVSCVLTFDLIRELLETTVGTDEESPDKGFSEMDVELILVVIRCTCLFALYLVRLFREITPCRLVFAEFCRFGPANEIGRPECVERHRATGSGEDSRHSTRVIGVNSLPRRRVQLSDARLPSLGQEQSSWSRPSST
jgi:hypothetical protein